MTTRPSWLWAQVTDPKCWPSGAKSSGGPRRGGAQAGVLAGAGRTARIQEMEAGIEGARGTARVRASST